MSPLLVGARYGEEEAGRLYVWWVDTCIIGCSITLTTRKSTVSGDLTLYIRVTSTMTTSRLLQLGAAYAI